MHFVIRLKSNALVFESSNPFKFMNKSEKDDTGWGWLGCGIPLLICIVAVFFFWSCNRQYILNQSNEKQLSDAKKNDTELRLIKFAEAYSAEIPDLEIGNRRLLSVEKQRRLMPGKPVALKVRDFDVFKKGAILVLTGEISGVYGLYGWKIELMIDDQLLESVKSIKKTSNALNVIAKIEDINSKPTVEVSDGSAYERNVFTSSGRVIAVESWSAPESSAVNSE